MSQEQTSLFDVAELDTELTRRVLGEVYESLEERGYNPTNQIVGYLISGDPGYISSYKEARNKIQGIWYISSIISSFIFLFNDRLFPIL